MIPLDREPRDRPQQIGFGPVGLQIFHRLGDQQLRLPPRPVAAEQGDEGLLPLRPVLADLLAGLRLLALLVEQVVGDLEGEADVAGIAAQPRPALGRRPRPSSISAR